MAQPADIRNRSSRELLSEARQLVKVANGDFPACEGLPPCGACEACAEDAIHELTEKLDRHARCDGSGILLRRGEALECGPCEGTGVDPVRALMASYVESTSDDE